MSQSKVNEMIRVLTDKPLKFTVRVHRLDGTTIEWQTDVVPKLDYNHEARCLFLAEDSYPNRPIMKWEEGMVMLYETNPGKHEDK